MVNIEFSVEEIKVSISLIDIAVKAGGLNVAEAGVVIAKKLSAVLQEVKEEQEK